MKAPLLRFSRSVHWISSALALMAVLFFALSGLTLNHATWFTAKPVEGVDELELGRAWLKDFVEAEAESQRLYMLSSLVAERWTLPLPSNIDQDDYEWVLDYQRPGGLSTIVLDLEAGMLVHEKIDDGFVALINDLHKGRHSGAVWSLFIDLAALLSIVFSLSGLILLWAHARKRSMTWPLVAVGLIFPFIVFWIWVP
ncbi:PepSY-associated TM helix domain-containing protein [Agaribacterium haliotis]|uniref:PepSY-associated TM helix domain-containing protein n=1 Tax=Agaribacterium haliotis TaxID=2013869 RepID=UPI000BB56BEC|nr:PepSY-associated TM helix domain-containing protein [Agaribacterium haliotis]